MNVLEKILEEIDEEQNGYEADHAWNYSKGLEYAKEIIRSHMGEREAFKFDFNRVKSFECQCGRHYVNTYNDGWIPHTGKNVPDKEDIYLVTCDDEEYPVKRMRFKKEDEYGLWYDNYGIYDGVILAWQPLPEPYKEEIDENRG